MSNKFNFDIVQKKLQGNAYDCMRELAMANKNYFVRSFNQQGWGQQRWKEVNRRIPDTKEYKYPAHKDLRRRTRFILVGKGTLRRAVNNSIKSVTANKVVFQVNLPYAARHNEGLAGMPKRQYMGESDEMKAKNIDIINKYAQNAFKS